MILVDSSVWIAYFNDQDIWQVDVLENLLGDSPVLIGDLILTEVLQGFRHDKEFHKAKEFLSFLDLRDLGGYKVVTQAAMNYRLIRQKGITVRKTIDMIIGTFCIENKITLLHDDHDFDPMEKFLGLKVVKPEVYQ